ncbi:MAG TPA: T9SS type A sorting domain-containing protein [candidate division Zixibacteria bacterium]
MKRNLTLVFLLSLFCLTSFNLALAQDSGIRDTCYVDRITKVRPDTQVIMNVYIVNDEALGAFTIPLRFPDSISNLDITCDSISFVGTRSESAAFKSDSTSINNAKNRLVALAIWITELGIGNVASGPVAKIYFTTGSSWDSTSYVPVDTLVWPPVSELEFVPSATGIGFMPVFLKGALEVREVNTPSIPTVFSLSQNYPNPFNPKTLIRFTLPKDSWVNIEVYNILGQRVKTLVNEKLTAGVKEVEWDSKGDNGLEVASGIYFYRIKADDFSDIKKMVMLK